jgi:hypothetical protein
MTTAEAVANLVREIISMGARVDYIRVDGKKTVVVRINGKDEVYKISRVIDRGYVKSVLVPVSPSSSYASHTSF